MSSEIKQPLEWAFYLDGMAKSIWQAVATELGTNSVKVKWKTLQQQKEQRSKSNKAFGSVWG